MHLAQRCHYAIDVFAGRLADKQIHYGLVFVLPDGRDRADCASVRKCSDLDTRSRHGTVEDWDVGVPLASLPPEQVVLLIPRTWLIRHGYLPWWVLFAPYGSFAIRRADALRRHLWLEWPECDSRDSEEAALKVA